MASKASPPATGQNLIGSNPILDNPLNPVWDVEQAGHSAANTYMQGKKIVNTVSNIGNTAGNVANTASAAASGLGSVATFLTSAQNWVRIGEVIAGLILLVMGLHQLAGGGPNIVVSGVKKAASVRP